jgi:hypothetical protein
MWHSAESVLKMFAYDYALYYIAWSRIYSVADPVEQIRIRPMKKPDPDMTHEKNADPDPDPAQCM